MDASSIEVNRRARRAKTDRLDLGGVLSLLVRDVQRDRRACRMGRGPSLSEEDARQLHRTWDTIQQDRTRLINRLKGVWATQGVQLAVHADFVSRLEAARLWDGTPGPDGLKQRRMRVWAQLEFLNTQRAEAKEARAALERGPQTTTGRCVAQLQTCRAIGPTGAWVLTPEIFDWRQIRNGRQLGALVGLVPAPYQSGETSRDQGITRAGNTHVRRITVQLAWNGVRYQPDSALTLWYQRRVGGAGGRMRRIGIVALARKLLIARWRYLETGALPDGAALKA